MADIFIKNRIRTMKSEGKTDDQIFGEISTYHFFDFARLQKNGDLLLRFEATGRKIRIKAKTLEVVDA